MPNEPQRPQRPGWKSAGKQPGPRPKHAWQGGTAKASAEAAPRGLSRRGKLAIVGVGFGLLVISLVILIRYIRPPKASHLEIIVAADETDVTTPFNAHGAQADRGAKLVEHEKLEVERHSLGVDNDPWKAVIENSTGTLLKSKPPEKVVLFLAIPGGADERDPYLIPGGSNPTDSSRFLRLSGLLDKLRELPPETKKLVVFDAVQAPSFWPLGLVRNDFARRLKEQEQQIKSVKNLVVICSADEGQRSWIAEEWGQSAFAHYFMEALRGKQGDRRTAEEIFDRVKRDVGEWVYGNWAASQEPIMLGDISTAKSMDFAGQGGSDVAGIPELPGLDGLSDAWAKHDELAKSFPPPWATAPHLWREYLDRLIRYENLLRIGGDAKAAREKLTALGDKIASAGREPLTSLRATLSASTALASRAARDPGADLEKGLKHAWDGLDKDPAGLDAAVKELGDLSSADPVRWSALLGLLLKQAMRDPAKNLARACDLAGALISAKYPPPAEILLMLELNSFHKDRQKPLEPDYIRTALSIRKQGEEAALGLTGGNPLSDSLPAYSEQVLPWIKDDVNAGDGSRRVGEDNLFSGEKAAWITAAGLLKKAAGHYEKAQATALHIRSSTAVRDQLLVSLPYYAQWQADARDPTDAVIGDIVKLCRQAHDLDKLLTDPKRTTPPAELRKKAEEARIGFQALEETFTKRCQGLDGNAATQTRRHAIEAALEVPFIDSELRLKLVDGSRNIGRRFREEARPEAKRDLEQEKKHEHALADSQAIREARLALAVFGVDGPEGDSAGAGRLIAEQWSKRFRTVREETDKGGTAADLAEARKALVSAGAGAQRLDGAAANCLTGANPIAARRHVQLHDLLIWLADRTYRDHWFWEGGAMAYYRRIGQDYMNDARELIKMDYPSGPGKAELEQRFAEVNAGDKHFAAAEKIEGRWLDGAMGEKDLNLTDETAMRREFSLTIPEPVSEGAVALRFERGNGLLPHLEDWRVKSFEPNKREFVDRDDFSLEKTSPPDRPRAVESKHILRAYFRGYYLPLETKIALHRRPNIVAAQHRMPPGGLVVQARKDDYNAFRAENMAVAFILDGSGSMRTDPFGKDGTKAGNRRFDRALDALEIVLGELPSGINVSLRIFIEDQNRNRQDRVLWPMKPWRNDPDLVKERIKELRGLKPEGQTPLIENMRLAAEKDFLPDFKGMKVMVVLTDGGDSDNTAAQIPGAVLKHFKKPAIADEEPPIRIHVIGFEVEDEDKEKNEKLKHVIREIGGTFNDVNDKAELERVLRESLRGLRYWVEDNNHKPVGRGEVNESTREYKWVKPLGEGFYSLQMRLRGKSSLIERKVRIAPGDFLVLNLIPQPEKRNTFLFQRDIYARSYAVDRLGSKPRLFPDKANEWQGAVFSKERKTDGSLDVMTTLEKQDNPLFELGDEGTPLQRKPDLIWYELNAEGYAEPLALRYDTLERYPAPAWLLNVRSWPTRDGRPLNAALDVWWLDRFLANDATNPYSRTLEAGLKPGSDFIVDKLQQKLELPFARGKETIYLENIGIETMTLGKLEQECLVVRLRYPQAKRFMVRLITPPQAPDADQEHRFYFAAGKYTGVFGGWSVKKLDALRDSLRIELIDVNALKDVVKDNGYSRIPLGAPDRNPRPQPPVGETVESR
jgi:Mg-chelatase subunit ChlD